MSVSLGLSYTRIREPRLSAFFLVLLWAQAVLLRKPMAARGPKRARDSWGALPSLSFALRAPKIARYGQLVMVILCYIGHSATLPVLETVHGS